MARATIAEDPDLWVHIVSVFAPFVPLALVAGVLYRFGMGASTRRGRADHG